MNPFRPGDVVYYIGVRIPDPDTTYIVMATDDRDVFIINVYTLINGGWSVPNWLSHVCFIKANE
jgi:hypothetical protein